ncbi:MAG: prepilin-type N-terminal cleavage/methylation domain-containing protein [Verrucomicrobiota bacterium]|nr:prepilin-type N-terminal cleavage/methylation domain-containing protein [Verrucomicrobiota bacterium]
MKLRCHSPRHRLAGYSLIEVSIAIAIVAVGMIAIFGILPAGLNVQRDNRQETVIKYEALYWMEALRSGGAALPVMNRVDWIEVKRLTGTYTADYTMMGPEADWKDSMHRGPVTNTNQLAYMKDLKRSLWRTDILGWLSSPDSGTSANDFENAAAAKRVRVRSFSGPIGKPLDYIMECQVLPDPGGGRLCTIRLTFTWPVIERPWSQITPWAGSSAWPLEVSAITGNYDFTEVGKGRKVYTTRAALPGPVPPGYPGLAVMNTNLSLSNAVATGGTRRYFSGGSAFGGYPYQAPAATPVVTNINRLPLTMHFIGSEETP